MKFNPLNWNLVGTGILLVGWGAANMIVDAVIPDLRQPVSVSCCGDNVCSEQHHHEVK